MSYTAYGVFVKSFSDIHWQFLYAYNSKAQAEAALSALEDIPTNDPHFDVDVQPVVVTVMT